MHVSVKTFITSLVYIVTLAFRKVPIHIWHSMRVCSFPTVFLWQTVFSKDGHNKISLTWSLYNTNLIFLPLKDGVCLHPLNLGRFVTSGDLILCDSRGWVIKGDKFPPASFPWDPCLWRPGAPPCNKREASMPGHVERTWRCSGPQPQMSFLLTASISHEWSEDTPTDFCPH